MNNCDLSKSLERLNDGVILSAGEAASRKSYKKYAAFAAAAVLAVGIAAGGRALVRGTLNASAPEQPQTDGTDQEETAVRQYESDATGDLSVELLGIGADGMPKISVTCNSPENEAFKSIVNGTAEVTPKAYYITTADGHIVTLDGEYWQSHNLVIGEREYCSEQTLEDVRSDFMIFNEDIDDLELISEGYGVVSVETSLIDGRITAISVGHYGKYRNNATGATDYVILSSEDYSVIELDCLTISIDSLLIEAEGEEPLEVHGSWTAECRV